MTEEKKEENAAEGVKPENVIELNRRNVALRKMHVPGTRSIANGMRLDLEHLFGLPNVCRNPYMSFYSDDDKLKAKAGTYRSCKIP